MNERVLITGGAGFIGSHLADLLLTNGYRVRVLDCLDPQVHGQNRKRPDYLDPEAELLIADVRDREAVDRALDGCEFLVHFAAAVGVAQSMYEISHYTSVNSLGAAVVLESAVERRAHLKGMLVASSMSIYGEGMYRCPDCGIIAPRLRPTEQLAESKWEIQCPSCSRSCEPIPVPESKPLYPTSIYAVNKRDHEEMFLAIGQAYDIPSCAMRFFNVYGTRQALSNPYTGVGAIFASRLMNDQPPLIFEDGLQSRDFIHVSDIARACVMALENPASSGKSFNVGTGVPSSILDIGKAIARELGKTDADFMIVNKFRAGDIRHCFSDASLIENVLGFKAEILFEEGVSELCSWVRMQSPEDLILKATEELNRRGLTR